MQSYQKAFDLLKQTQEFDLKFKGLSFLNQFIESLDLQKNQINKYYNQKTEI